jgi:hypothetical protein
MLSKTLLHIRGLAAIIATVGFALDDVYPCLHDKKKAGFSRLEFSLAPRVGLEPTT